MRSLKTIQKLSSLGSILSKIAFVLSVVGFCGSISVAVWKRILGRIAGLRMRVLLQPAGQHPRPVAAEAVDVRLVGDGAGQREFSGIAVRILAVLRGQLRIAAVGMGMLRDFAEKLARAPGGSADRERRARR